MAFFICSLIIMFLSQSKATNCTSAKSQCPNNGICNPNTDECVDQNETVFCGQNGEYLQCGNKGVIWAECGSGAGSNCQSKELCPNHQSGYEAISCNYPGLEPLNKTFDTVQWLCGKHGKKLSCSDIGGSVLVGVCGSGSNAACADNVCPDKSYHAILCAQAQYFETAKCQWIKGREGEWVYCGQEQVAAGHCGSGREAKCGIDEWHSLQCCTLFYY